MKSGANNEKPQKTAEKAPSAYSVVLKQLGLLYSGNSKDSAKPVSADSRRFVRSGN
ncbi:hypothetical protein [Bowmanella denitrificans]|uniref:hypothetical protein n=1 Tax=Bowmanella denitrificans TaxID=366582 RepID=UPI0015585035|nr:hypothetical protein [Bowmanella denitrificans]